MNGNTVKNDVSDWKRRWARASRHVYAGRLIVEVQRLRIACLAAGGKQTYLAEQMLQLFITTLELLEFCERRLWELASANRETTPAEKSMERDDSLPATLSGGRVHPAVAKQEPVYSDSAFMVFSRSGTGPAAAKQDRHQALH